MTHRRSVPLCKRTPVEMHYVVFTRLALIAALCLGHALPSAASRSRAPATAVRRSVAADTTLGFCVCPPGPVSDRISVELRLGIRNRSAADRRYRVSFFLDRIDARRAVYSAPVSVAAGAARLVSHRLRTAGRIGTRRVLYRVERDGSLVARGAWPLEVLPSDTRALPWATCLWLDPGNMLPGTGRAGRATPAEVRRMVDAIRDLGATSILISYVEGIAFKMGPFYPSRIPELGTPALDFDAVGVVLDQAARNGQHVLLGLGRGPDLTLVYDGVKDPARVTRALELGRRVARELWDRYARYRSLYGWYLSHEPTDLAAAAAFLNPITDFLHALAPEKPVVVAPSGTPILTPQVLANAHYDVLTYQDAVGPGYVPYRYTWNPENRLAQLDDVCRAYAKAHRNSGKHLWSDTETWEMAGPTYGNPYPAAFSRVLRQMDIAKRHFDILTLYEFMATMRPAGLHMGADDPRATALYDDYRAYAVAQISRARERAGRKRGATPGESTR